MAITSDNIPLSEPIRDAEAAGYSIRRSEFQTGNLDPAVCEPVSCARKISALTGDTRRAFCSHMFLILVAHAMIAALLLCCHCSVPDFSNLIVNFSGSIR